MVRGSKVEMRTLKQDLSATGNSFSATIKNNSGDFDFGNITIASPYAQLTADGYFFNEVTGNLSAGRIQLDAIVDLTDKSSVNVNVLTHLKSRRLARLICKGKTFREADEEAQREVMRAFGLEAYADKDVSQYSIVGGDDVAGALIAVTSLILYERSEAQIVEL